MNFFLARGKVIVALQSGTLLCVDLSFECEEGKFTICGDAGGYLEIKNVYGDHVVIAESIEAVAEKVNFLMKNENNLRDLSNKNKQFVEQEVNCHWKLL